MFSARFISLLIGFYSLISQIQIVYIQSETKKVYNNFKKTSHISEKDSYLSSTKDDYLEIKFNNRNQVDNKIAWG